MIAQLPSPVHTDLKIFEASALVVDIRNFTPNLYSGTHSRRRRADFCRFLARFYDTCLQACTLTCGDPTSFYMNGTGDGMLAVFLASRHFLNAYLTGLILSCQLDRVCQQYNRSKLRHTPDVGFGMGLDSGDVQRVTSRTPDHSGRPIDTYIGNCINAAARLESLTKNYTRTNLLISGDAMVLLARRILNEDYRDLMARALNDDLAESERRRLWRRMAELNEELLLTFMQMHNVRGLPTALPVFRLSPSLAAPTRSGLPKLLAKICVDAAQRDRILKLLTNSVSSSLPASRRRKTSRSVRPEGIDLHRPRTTR